MPRPQETDAFDDGFAVRCWADQKERWEIMAKKADLNLSDYVRGVLIRHERENERTGITQIEGSGGTTRTIARTARRTGTGQNTLANHT